MDSLNIALLIVGLLVLALGLLTEPLKWSLLSTPLLALAVGVMLGPAVTGLLDISEGGARSSFWSRPRGSRWRSRSWV